MQFQQYVAKLEKFKKYILPATILVVLIALQKTFFFFTLFVILTFIGKYIRGQFGLSIVVLDPLLFFAIIIAKYMDLKFMLLYLAIVIPVADLVTGLFTEGSIINFILYIMAPTIGVFLFGNYSLMVYGNVASLIYSVSYFLVRRLLIPDDPFKVISKISTSFIFTFLYITFLGPLLDLILA